jgi:hypothetical protein
LINIGSRSDDYLTGFQDACQSYATAIRALPDQRKNEEGKR